MPDTLVSERRLDFEAKFNAWNLEFEYVPELSLTDLAVIDGAQVRSLEHIAPPERLGQYVLQMKASAAFPPITVAATLFDQTDVLIDGNTRARAAQQLKLSTFPAYRVSPIPDDVFARMLGAALNSLGGDRLEREDGNRIALLYMDLGWSDLDIAREIGFSAESVRRWRREIEFTERVERLGLQKQAGGLTKTQRAQLAKVTHDGPFGEVVKLAADYKLQAPDFKETVTKVAEATSDEEALTIIGQVREESRPIGPPPGRAYRNPVARQARMHIGGLLKVNPAEVFDPTSAEQDLEKWRELRAIVDQILAVFESHKQLT